MRRSLIILLFLLFAPAASGAATAEVLRDGFSSSYALSYNGIEIGVTERNLIPLGDGSLVFKSTAYPTGLAAVLLADRVVERSLLKLAEGGLRPVEYSYRQSGGKKTREADLYFSWPRGELITQPANRNVPLPENALDALSFQLALMRDLEAGKKSFVYQIADRRRLREYRFEVQGTETIHTPHGRFETVHVRAQNEERDRNFDFWCAPALGYLPVRIVYRDDGDESRLILSDYDGPGA